MSTVKKHSELSYEKTRLFLFVALFCVVVFFPSDRAYAYSASCDFDTRFPPSYIQETAVNRSYASILSGLRMIPPKRAGEGCTAQDKAELIAKVEQAHAAQEDALKQPDNSVARKDALAKEKGSPTGEVVCDSAAKNLLLPVCWVRLIAVTVGWLLLSLSAWLLAIADMLFNWTVDNTILLFSTAIFAKVSGGVNAGWTAMRDIANIVIIGMFTFIAIATILGVAEYGAKKLLARVLIIAVLINFSLIFTKVIIDFSNFTAAQFYSSASGLSMDDAQKAAAVRSDPKNTSGTIGAMTDLTGNDGSVGSIGGFKTTGISGAFLGFLKVTSVSDTFKSLDKLANDAAGGWYVALAHGILAAILLGGAACVLFYGVYLLISRAVLFIFLMVTAAGAFATHLIPKMNESTYGWNGWWSSLLHNAALAPFLMIFLWITLQVSSSIAAANPNGALGNLATAEVGSADVSTLFSYFIILGLLWGSFLLASKWASKVGGLKFTGTILSSLPLGTAALASRFIAAPIARKFIGGGGAARSMMLQDKIKERSLAATKLDPKSKAFKDEAGVIAGMMKQKDRADWTAKQSWNAANLAQPVMKALGVPSFLSGATKSGGYAETVKERAEKAIKGAEKVVLKKEDISDEERARIRRGIVRDRQNSQNLRNLRAAAVGLRSALATALADRTAQMPGKTGALSAAQRNKAASEQNLAGINQQRTVQIPLVAHLKADKGNADAALNFVRQEKARIITDSANEIAPLQAAVLAKRNAGQNADSEELLVRNAEAKRDNALVEQDAKIREAEAKAIDIGTRVTTEEGNLNAINTQAQTASNNVATATNTINTLEADIKGLNDAVVNAEAKIKESDKDITAEKARMLKGFKEGVDSEVEAMVNRSKGLAVESATSHAHNRLSNMLNVLVGQTEDDDTIAKFTRKQASSSAGIKYKDFRDAMNAVNAQLGNTGATATTTQQGGTGTTPATGQVP